MARQPTSWATRIQSGIVSVVTPNNAITESGATLTVGRRAFSESGAPTMNGSHTTAATAPLMTGARQSLGRVASVSGRKMMPHGLATTAMPIARPAESGARTDLVQRDDRARQRDGVVEVPVAAELGPRERRQAATEEDEQLEVGVAAHDASGELVEPDGQHSERRADDRRQTNPSRG